MHLAMAQAAVFLERQETDGPLRDLLRVQLSAAAPPHASRAFLITPSYAAGFHGSLDWLVRINSVAASLLGASPHRLLSGVPLHRPDALQLAERTINLPYVVGVKIREEADDLGFRGIAGRIPRQFERIADLAHRHRKVILAHFSAGHTHTKTEGSTTEVDRLISIMSARPNAKLIIAHGGMHTFVGLDGLARIGRHFAQSPALRRNIYAEISHALSSSVSGPDELLDWKDFTVADWPKYERVVEAWKAFDTSYVLFGSDYPEEPDNLDFRTAPGLSASQKEAIAHRNAERLLGEVAITHR